jgi:bifunctional DNA-binding transcriptional regulator/antitoxin component of YhaV-PrlF toxin-antitoxin module
MKFATFTVEIQDGRVLKLPADVCDKLRIEAGDRVEISIKKVKSGRLDLMLSENPLNQLLSLGKTQQPEEKTDQ